MSEWIKERIDYAVTTYAGGTPNRSRNDYFNGDIPWISSGEVNQSYINKTKEYITILGIENSSAKWIPKGAVLLAMYGATAGQVAKLKIRATANQAVLALIPNEEIIDKDFLFHLLNIEKDKILFFAQGSGQPNLSKGLIDRYFILFPKSLKTQIKIAKILDTCDTVIEKTQAAIAKYKAIKQGMLHDLFTRGIDANGKLRPTYHDAPDLYKESELGMIPKEWCEGKFIDFADKNISHSFTGGPFGSDLQTKDYINAGVRIIQLQNIGDGYFKDEYKIYTSEEKANQLINCNIYSGEIIISKMADPIARACIIPDSEKRYLMASDGIRLSINKRKFNSRFVMETINHKRFRTIAELKSTGSTRTRIGLTELKDITVVYPSKSEIDAIGLRLDTIENKIRTEETLLQKYQSIKQGLMGDLLGGMVPVTVP